MLRFFPWFGLYDVSQHCVICVRKRNIKYILKVQFFFANHCDTLGVILEKVVVVLISKSED